MDTTPTSGTSVVVRRSPRLQLPFDDTAPSRQHAAVYAFVVDFRVKETVQQRLSTAKMFGEHHISGDTEDAIMQALWTLVSPRVENRATANENTWTVASERPGIEHFDFYVTFKFKTKCLSPREVMSWSVRNRGGTVALTAFKYGNQVGNQQHLAELKAACIDPEIQDRAGAATHEIQKKIVEQLKSRWGRLFRGHEMAWLMWAARIAKKAVYLRSVEVTQPPPAELARWFTPVGASAEEHVDALRRNVQLASEVVDGLIAHVIRVRDTQLAQFELLRNGFDGMMEMLETKKRNIDAYSADLLPLRDNEALLEELAHIPNVPDDCHAP
ncbi:hypothetical protein AeRB84_016691 [Aphanomyces euteiches]|nr:hypothetical protein AeRB84_016691 [Aphanomyces euteiches]